MKKKGLMAAEVSSPLADVTRSEAIYISVGDIEEESFKE